MRRADTVHTDATRRRGWLRSPRLGAAAAAILATGAAASATTFVDVSLERRINEADAVVVARVDAVVSRLSEDGVVTDIHLDVEQVLAGAVDRGPLVIRQLGGKVGDDEAWIDGSPRYHTGERAVVFLGQASFGPTTAGLARGRWPVDVRNGVEWAVQDRGDACLNLAGRERLGPVEVPVDEIRRLAASKTATGRRIEQRRDAYGRDTEPAPSFTLHSTGRYFEPDTGSTIPFFVNATDWPAGRPDLASALADALAAWSLVDGSSLRLVPGGPETSGCGWRRDGVSRVSVDCRNDIAGSGCTSVIAIGGPTHISGPETTVNGVVFKRTIESDVVLADGWCDYFESAAALREVLTHELGHCIGLGHSADQTATMAAYIHNDGRGASLRDDDRQGVRFVYPARPAAPDPLAISAVPALETVVGRAFEFQFTASGGAAPFAWSLAAGELPQGLSLDASGRVAGAATAPGNFAFTVAVVDGAGQTASAQAGIDVRTATAPLEIPSQSNSTPVAGRPHTATLAARGGEPPLVWSLVSGDLPTGLSLDASGRVAGTPERSGTWYCRIRVADSLGDAAEADFRTDVEPSPVRVSAVRWASGRSKLVVSTPDAAPDAALRINGRDVTLSVRSSPARGRVTVRGTSAELGLRPGTNTLVLRSSATWSEPVEFQITSARPAAQEKHR